MKITDPYASSPSEEIRLIVNVELKPDTDAQFEKEMELALQKNRAEDGNVSFEFFKVQGSVGKYFFVERWKNQAALDWHMEQNYTRDLFDMFAKTLSYPLSDAHKHINFVTEFYPE